MSNRSREEEWTNLMRAAIVGDSSAYCRFLTLATPHFRAVARNRCRAFQAPASDAEDIVQEVLLTIHLKRHTWDPSRPIGPWISAITRNKVIDCLRRKHRDVLVPLDDVLPDFYANGCDDPSAGQDLDRMLLKLKETERQIVRSISLHGNTLEETAASLKMSVGSVRVALHRALKRLAALYRSDGREDSRSDQRGASPRPNAGRARQTQSGRRASWVWRPAPLSAAGKRAQR